MEKLFYEEPSPERKEEALEYIKEHHDFDSKINGSGGLDRYTDDYEGWLVKIEEDRNRQPSEEKVPALTYFLIRESDNRIVGMVNIRLCLNEKLRKSGGHIGYGIRPTERRKGYNKVNLYLALQECQSRGIEKVMLSCDRTNLGSQKTMLALGGELEREYEKDGIVEENYWIDVSKSLEKNRDIYANQIGKKK